MGIFDKFTSDDTSSESNDADDASSQVRGEPRNEEYVDGDDYQAEQYARDDLSDELSVIFADRWPTGKPLSDYELIYVSDPEVEDPIVLRCIGELFIPKGTKLLPFEDMTGVAIEDKTYWCSHAQLINPELASFIDYDWDYKAPEAIEGRVVAPSEPKDHEVEFLKTLIGTMNAELGE